MPDFESYQPRVGQQDVPTKSVSQWQQEYFARVAKLNDEVEQRMLEMGLLTNSTWLYFEEEAPKDVEGLVEVGREYVGLAPPVKREVLIGRDVSTFDGDELPSNYAGIMIMEKLWFERLNGVDYFTREATIDYDGDAFNKTGLVYCSKLEEDGKGGLKGAHPNSQEPALHYLSPTTNTFFWRRGGRVTFMWDPTFESTPPALSLSSADGKEREVYPTGLYWHAADALFSLSVAEDIWSTVKCETPADGGSFIDGEFKQG